jgi:uncharacterized membrane protein (UPF0182 family)
VRRRFGLKELRAAAGRGSADHREGGPRLMSSLVRFFTSLRVLWLLIPLLVAALLALGWLADLFWFQAIGYGEVFWRLLAIRLGLFAAATLIVFVYAWVNLRLLTRRVDLIGTFQTTGPAAQVASLAPPGVIRAFELLAPLIAALVIGLGFAEGWDAFIRFLWAQPFGQTDPLYGHDIGFYLFRLPFLDRIQNTVTMLAFAATVLLFIAYRRAGLIGYRPAVGIVAPRAVLNHVLANAVLFLLAWASGYVLDRYGLLTESTGAVFGAGYTAVHVTRFALWAAALLTVLFALAAYAAVAAGRARLVFALAGGFLGAMLMIQVVLPVAVQRLMVEPNELELEQPYLKRNIDLTRTAFGLDAVESRAYDPKPTLTMAEIEANEDTVNNIRLWDWQPLKQTFRQLQQIRTYYTFEDVDVDRYPLHGDLRQVLLSGRELSQNLPGKGITWVNRRLQYTHGYGLVMTPGADKTPDGRPVLVIRDIPPATPPGLEVQEPAIYYGEEESGYRLVNTGVREFDYPKGDDNVYTSYQGHGGVLLDTSLKRLVYAWHEFDINLLISDYLRADSRIQLWRQIQDRIGKIAPFLVLDRDPYLVLDRGRLVWIQDAYTTAERFPYAEPTEAGISYIRNSVKIVVDAYQGDVSFYAIDPKDPVLRVYAAAFPGLFQPFEALPAGLKAHLRYPEDLFAIQAGKYAVYHMNVPHVFYNSEDLWQIPQEKYGGRSVPVEPYYVLIRMPGEPRLEFLLLTPLTPAHRDNMIAWLAARSDPPHYGQLVVFRLPKERLVLGPTQIEATIDQDTTISQQLSLWDQRGSQVLRGNLLVIPIDDAFVYVEPVYLRAEDNDIPQLKRVIVSDGQKVAMEPTLGQSLQVVFGGAPETSVVIGGASAAPPAGLAQARQALDAAQQALAKGDWATFGGAMQRLRDTLGHEPTTQAGSK